MCEYHHISLFLINFTDKPSRFNIIIRQPRYINIHIVKISASIYSDSGRDLEATIQKLSNHQVDLIHVDCKDDVSVFEDIDLIRKYTDLPIDLHIISHDPSKYFPLIESRQVEYVTFQYEVLDPKNIYLPPTLKSKTGIALVSDTPLDVLDRFEADFDFVLFMATVPGMSRGIFDKTTFRKIRQFQKKYPSKHIHVDGGVNDEVSFILRNMGVHVSVSGSYIFDASTIDSALLGLKHNEVASTFLVKDFMMDLDESPVVVREDFSVEAVINEMDRGKLGFVSVVLSDGRFYGIIGNADLRQGILRHMDDLRRASVDDFVNVHPVIASEDMTVRELLELIKKQNRPILYLPVIDDAGRLSGTVNFLNMIKEEL